MATMPPNVAGLQAQGTGSILDWLKEMYLQRFRQPGGGAAGGGVPALPIGGAGYGMGSAIAAPDIRGPAPPPSVAGPTPPRAVPTPTGPSQLMLPRAPTAPGAPVGVPASTKLAPRSPLMFSWGGAAPEAYAPGATDIYGMPGAPPQRMGFMGAPPVSSGGAGGFAPSQTDWGNVANPGAFEAFREAPAIEQQMRDMQDPLWRERETAAINRGAWAGAQKDVLQAQADILRQENERMRQQVDDLYNQAVQREESRRKLAKQPPLTDTEKDDIYMGVRDRFLGGAGLLGGGTR